MSDWWNVPNFGTQSLFDPNTGSAGRYVGNMMYPGLGAYLAHPQLPPPQTQANAAGKIPPANWNPYAAGAVGDLAGLAAGAISGGSEAGPGFNAIRAMLGNMFSTPAEAAPKHASLPGAPFPPQGTPAPTGAMPQPTQPDAGIGNMRPDFQPADIAQMNELKSNINRAMGEITKINARTDIGVKGKGEASSAWKDQISSYQAQLDRMTSSMQAQQAAFDKATLPIAARDADFVTNARNTMLGVDAGAALGHGLAYGLAGKPGFLRSLAHLGGSVLGGAVVAPTGVLYPQAMDLGQPEGTKALAAAQHNLAPLRGAFDEPGAWDYTKNVVAPEAGLGAGFAGAAHIAGQSAGALGRIGAQSLYKAGQGIRSLLAPISEAPAAAPPPLVPPGTSGRYPSLSDTKALAAYQKTLRPVGNGYQDNRGWVSKQYWPPQ